MAIFKLKNRTLQPEDDLTQFKDGLRVVSYHVAV